MALTVSCYGPQNEAVKSPDGSGYFPIESLRSGRILEALVDIGLSGPEIPLDLCILLDFPTQAPQLPAYFKPTDHTSKNILSIIATIVGVLVVLSALVLFMR